MTPQLTRRQLEYAGKGYDLVAARSFAIGADCYIDPGYLEVEREQIFRRSWQYLCHEEKLREPGSFLTASVQAGASSRSAPRTVRCVPSTTSASIAGTSCCRGGGTRQVITCPYHGWVYGLDGRLRRARRCELIEHFDPAGIFLTPVQVEVFCHLRVREPGPGGGAARRADGRPRRRG